MTPVFAARRRAEEFDSLVEAHSTGADTRYAEVLEIVAAMRAVPAPEARPEFVSSLREQLMLAADTLLVPAESATGADTRLALPVRRPVRERRLAAAVGGLALVGATTSMAMAAQSALPGDVLYPLKRAIENAEAGISVNDGQRGTTLLANATGRLEEVTELTREGGAAEVPETLNAFTEQSIEASDLLLSDYATSGDETSISELRDFTAESMEILAMLEAVVPAAARDELLHAARVLTQIDNEAAQACPACGGTGISEIPAILIAPVGLTTVAVEEGTTIATETEPGDGSGDGGEGQQTPEVPATGGGALPPGSVLSPTTGPDTSGSGGNGGAQTQDDPIASLTAGLTGGDGSQPASNQPSLPGVPDPADAVDDVTDPVEDVTDSLTGGSDKDDQGDQGKKMQQG